MINNQSVRQLIKDIKSKSEDVRKIEDILKINKKQCPSCLFLKFFPSKTDSVLEMKVRNCEFNNGRGLCLYCKLMSFALKSHIFKRKDGQIFFKQFPLGRASDVLRHLKNRQTLVRSVISELEKAIS